MKTSRLLKSQDSVAQITISNSSHKNALNLELIKELTEAFRQSSADKSIGCILLSGEGSEAFCSGADLKELLQSSTLLARKQFFSAFAELIIEMHKSEKPVVSKIHGFALAGGCGLVASSDIALAADDAKFGLPEVKIGLAPLIVMAPLKRVINQRSLNYLALSGQAIDASEAFRINLITKVIKKESLDQEAMSLCKEIASFSKSATSVIREKSKNDLQEIYFREIRELADRIALLSLSKEASEGISSFLQKRKAK